MTAFTVLVRATRHLALRQRFQPIVSDDRSGFVRPPFATVSHLSRQGVHRLARALGPTKATESLRRAQSVLRRECTGLPPRFDQYEVNPMELQSRTANARSYTSSSVCWAAYGADTSGEVFIDDVKTCLLAAEKMAKNVEYAAMLSKWQEVCLESELRKKLERLQKKRSYMEALEPPGGLPRLHASRGNAEEDAERLVTNPSSGESTETDDEVSARRPKEANNSLARRYRASDGMELLGDIKASIKSLHKVNTSVKFWVLYDQIVFDKSGFLANRESLLEACFEGNLYTLQFNETEDLFRDVERRGALGEILRSSPSSLTVPAFCVANGGRCEMIWVSPRLRRMGIASQFIHELNITWTTPQLGGSEDFWRHHGLSSCQADSSTVAYG